MRITQAQFDAASNAAFDAANASSGEALLTDRALLAFVSSLGIEIADACSCDPQRPMYCASAECVGGAELIAAELIWVERTWVDVRTGDVVRPPGVDAVATVAVVGPVVAWGVNDVQPLNAYERRDIQYNPGRYAGSYAARKVVMAPLDSQPVVERQMRADAPVEIRMTRGEVAAIELLGGWGQRLDPPTSDVQESESK